MKKPNVYYGYWIVAVAFFCQFIQAGAVSYAFPLLYRPLQAEFDWGRGTIAVAYTIYFATMGLASPFIGRIVDRYGARMVIPCGALMVGLGFLFLSLVQNLWSFYVSYIVIGLGMVAMGPVSATQTISSWFTRRRGLAVGIMATGIGVEGFVLAPIIGAFLIPNLGWRTTYLAMAILTWVLIIPAALLVIRSKPSDMGLYPDGVATAEAVTEAKLSSKTSESWPVNMAIKTSTFWLISVAFAANTFSNAGIFQHQVNHLTDIGFSLAAAATALGAVGLGSAGGKLIFGWLCDRLPAKYVATISFALQLVALIILINVKSTSPLVMLWAYAILIGLGIGGWIPTMSMLISRNFGLGSYGTIFGMLMLTHSLSTALGPLAAGFMYDAMQTYYWVFIMFLTLFTISIPSMLAVRRPKLHLSSGQQ
ncbi:MFS transporter [Chloroflexota bacterium]